MGIYLRVNETVYAGRHAFAVMHIRKGMYMQADMYFYMPLGEFSCIYTIMIEQA